MSVTLSDQKLRQLASVLNLPLKSLSNKAEIMGGLTNSNLKLSVLSPSGQVKNFLFYQELSRVPFFINREVERSINDYLLARKQLP